VAAGLSVPFGTPGPNLKIMAFHVAGPSSSGCGSMVCGGGGSKRELRARDLSL